MLLHEVLDNPLTPEEWQLLNTSLDHLAVDVGRVDFTLGLLGGSLIRAEGVPVQDRLRGWVRGTDAAFRRHLAAVAEFRESAGNLRERGPRQNPRRITIATIGVNPGFDLTDRACHPGNVTIIVGGRGTGKTAAGFDILEKAYERHIGRPLFAVGLPPEARKLVPKYIVIVNEVDDVPNGSVVLLEESALMFKARKSFSEANLMLVDTIDIARHKQLSLIFVTQSSALVDVNIMRLGDTLAIKEPSLLQVELERRQVKQVMVKAASALDKIPEKERLGKCYIIDTKYEGITDTGLPTFWSDELSRMYESHQVRNANPSAGTMDAISYYCGGDTEVGLCPKDAGSRYIHHFQKNKPKVMMNEEGKMWILGKVEVKESGINDYAGSQNDYSQLDPPPGHRKIGELVSVNVNGEELLVKDGILATDSGGERLFVIDKPPVGARS